MPKINLWIEIRTQPILEINQDSTEKIIEAMSKTFNLKPIAIHRGIILGDGNIYIEPSTEEEWNTGKKFLVLDMLIKDKNSIDRALAILSNVLHTMWNIIEQQPEDENDGE